MQSTEYAGERGEQADKGSRRGKSRCDDECVCDSVMLAMFDV